jgi:hypothetical protein
VDKLLEILADVEHIIRYLLSGAVLVAIWLATRADWQNFFAKGANNLGASAVVVIAVGFTVYTIYRLLFWTIGDRVARWCKLSAMLKTAMPVNEEPATSCRMDVAKVLGEGFADDYAAFLVWRHSGAVPEVMSRYLFYRWAVAHFAILVAIALPPAILISEPGSLISKHPHYTCVVSISCMLLGLLQCSLLYKVEQWLRLRQQKPPSRQEGDDKCALRTLIK